MKIPNDLREELRHKLWDYADELGWQALSWVEKSPQYEAWTKDSEIGGRLSRYMDQRRVRVYIKDTLMKGYVRSRQAGVERPFRALGINPDVEVAEEHERPHGRRLGDGRVIAWGNADDWKLVLTAMHERSYGVHGARPFAAVLMSSVGKYAQLHVREMVQDAADKLGVERLLWLS